MSRIVILAISLMFLVAWGGAAGPENGDSPTQSAFGDLLAYDGDSPTQSAFGDLVPYDGDSPTQAAWESQGPFEVISATWEYWNLLNLA